MFQSVMCDALFVATKVCKQMYREHNNVCKMSFGNYTPLHFSTFKAPSRFWYMDFFHGHGNNIHNAF
jgi:hypothetical protein